MRVFKGFAILLTVTMISVGTFMLYDPMDSGAQQLLDSVIAGAVLFSWLLPSAISSQGRRQMNQQEPKKAGGRRRDGMPG